MIAGIHHIQLAMPIGGEQILHVSSCSHLFGIPEVPKPADLLKRGGVWFESTEVRIHLGVEADFRPARKAHPGLLVRDLPKLIERLRKAGLEVIEDDRESLTAIALTSTTRLEIVLN